MHYVVTYTANSNDEHWADPVYHTNKFERIFKEEVDALHFLGECTSVHANLLTIGSTELEETRTLRTEVDEEGTIIYYY